MKKISYTEICEKLGIREEIKFIKVYKRNNKIFIDFTCGKREEIIFLKKQVLNSSFFLGRKLKKF